MSWFKCGCHLGCQFGCRLFRKCLSDVKVKCLRGHLNELVKLDFQTHRTCER